MISSTKGMKKKLASGLVPLLAAVMVTGAFFIACDPGDAPEGPSNISASLQALIDAAQPGITARMSPSTVSVPGTGDESSAWTSIFAVYRDANNNPVEGMQINITNDPTPSSNAVIPYFTVIPTANFTNADGAISARVRVNVSTPAGSYIFVAFTSPASGGPNAEGQATLRVNTTLTPLALQIATGSLDGNNWSDAGLPTTPTTVNVSMEAIGGSPPYFWSEAAGSTLPAGVSLSATGTLSGTPNDGTDVGSPYTVIITVTDSVGATANRTYNVVVIP